MKSYKTISDRRMLTGLRIRRERIFWGMTQEELAGILGISANYLGQIERGNRDLSRKMEDRLCALFHLDRNELHSIDNLAGAEHLAEDTLLMPQLQEEDIRRMLESCSPEELQFCGHVLRSMLLFLRHSDNPSDIAAAKLMQGFGGLPDPMSSDCLPSGHMSSGDSPSGCMSSGDIPSGLPDPREDSETVPPAFSDITDAACGDAPRILSAL